MSRRLSKRVALATTSTLLLLLYLAATNTTNRALLSTGHGDTNAAGSGSPQEDLTAKQANAGGDEGGGGGGKGGEWPDSWGREIGFRPGVRLPNLGRTPAAWEGVRSDSGVRSPFYGDIQRRHQDWLLRRAEEIRSGTSDGDSGGGSGEETGSAGEKAGVDGETPTGQEAQEDVEAVRAAEHEGGRDREGGGGQVVGTRYEGNGAETVDSEDWTRRATGAGADKGLGTESGKVGNAGRDAPGSVGAAVSGGADSNPEPATRRRLRSHQQEEPRGRQGQRRRQVGRGTASPASDSGEESLAEEGNASATAAASTAETTEERRRTAAVGWGWGWSGHVAESDTAVKNKERVRRLERGAELWGGTYVPPIEPQRRQGLIEKWSDARRGGGGRILYVITSFDRGKRLGRDYKQIDKLDYILMMMDEMREACELGFSPQVHLIAAWDPSEVTALMEERIFCQRTGKHVPFSYEEHPPSVRNNLAIKHRIYMKPRLPDFDVFLQVEDDMILTLNHILLYKEECEYLENRKGMGGSHGRPNVFVPGFMRVEPDGNDWVEWEIALSRFNPIKIFGAGIYMALRPSKILPRGGNNQGLWMATREQLARLSQAKGCRYLDFDESSTNGMPETHSGSIQMFHSECEFEKVFPATHFEDFIVHHRTNNKNGRRGESIPGVSMAVLRIWAEQFVRDENFLQVRHWTVPAPP